MPNIPTTPRGAARDPRSLIAKVFWNISRHELIASAAERLLSARALEKVAAITAVLPSGRQLRDLAAWADNIKRHTPDPTRDDPDTIAFLSDPRNRNQPNWHFVDIPVGAERYDRTLYPDFTNDEDVVQIIRAATRALAGESDRFSRLNALRLVTHLVADVHQPLHVGCGFIDATGPRAELVRDPDLVRAKHLGSDRGGNSLLLPVGGSRGTSLHSYWDSHVGDDGVVSSAEATIATGAAGSGADPYDKVRAVDTLIAMVRGSATMADASTASSDTSAEVWATESVLAAREAYSSLSIKGPSASGGRYDLDWEGQAAYDARCSAIATERLAKAAQRLASLLEKVLH